MVNKNKSYSRLLIVIITFIIINMINAVYLIFSLLTVVAFGEKQSLLHNVFIISCYFLVVGLAIIITVYKTNIKEIYDFRIPDMMQLNSNIEVFFVIVKISLFIFGFFIWAGAVSAAPFFLGKLIFHVFGLTVQAEVWEAAFIPMACVGMFSATGVMKFLLALK